ncbi:MAG: hypothetical protein ISR55_06470 [Bacteroidetes bacterium]|nr:hypothetical protein [Bacteroidota bacterium]
MSVYSLKVTVKNDPHFYRIIDVDASYPLIVLHKAILDSIDFTEGELASFYENYESKNDRVEYGLTDMQKEEGATLMKDVSIQDVLKNKGESITYVYDFLNMWIFDVHLDYIRAERNSDEKLPRIVEIEGENPNQEMFGGFDEKNLSEEDLKMLKNLIEKNDEFFDDEAGKMDKEIFDELDEDKDGLSGFESLDNLEDDIAEDDNW